MPEIEWVIEVGKQMCTVQSGENRAYDGEMDVWNIIEE